MVATFQTQINGRRDIKQVSVDVAAAEVNTDIPIPILPAGTIHGVPEGLALVWTYPDTQPKPGECVPSAKDQIALVRIIPTNTASVNAIFKSINPATGLATFASQPVLITQPNQLQPDDELPLYVCNPGDYLVLNVSAVSTFIIQIAVLDRWGAGQQA